VCVCVCMWYPSMSPFKQVKWLSRNLVHILCQYRPKHHMWGLGFSQQHCWRSSLSVCILLVECKTKFCSNIQPAFEKSSYSNRQSKPAYCKQTNCVSHTQKSLKNELKALVQVEKWNYWPKRCECSTFFKIYVRNSVTGLSYIPNIMWEYQRL